MFFKQDYTAVTISSENSSSDNESNLDKVINQPSPNTITLQSNSSCLSDINSTFSFSDLVCCTSLSLVQIFGMAGLGLGFGISAYFLKYMKDNVNLSDNMIVASLPFIGMFAGMFFGFYLWGKCTDRSMEWEESTAGRRAQGLMAACQYFFSSTYLNLTQSKDAENMLLEPVQPIDDTEESVTLSFG